MSMAIKEETIETTKDKIFSVVQIEPYIELFIENESLRKEDALALSPSSRSRKNLEILPVKIQHWWGNRARRRRIISPYFSESAFGSDTDTKEVLVNYHIVDEDDLKNKK